MPLVYQQNINATSKLGVWHIIEPEQFFLQKVSLKREITHPHKRLQHLAGRIMLTELYPDFPFELVRVADTKKPFLENEAFHFSISHCGNYAAVIVSRDYRVGVDVELTSLKVDKVKHKFLSWQEQALIVETSPAFATGLSIQLLTAAWSIKESLYKWYGYGEINFKKHLVIEKLVVNGNEGVAYCKFLKDSDIQLTVHFLFFNDHCISWVLSNVS
ncbi:hypothetical protein BH11BAC3_BH11BAC3_29710 [soil metagenome]